MPEFSLTTNSYPVGTEVGVFPDWSFRRGSSPAASAIDTQTMTADGLTFTGLDFGGRYCAHALVGSEHRYRFFTVESVDKHLTEDQLAALAGTGGDPDAANPYATKQTTDALLGADVDAVTAAGVPVLLGEDVLADGIGMNLDASGGAVAANIEGLEVTTPGPVVCTYQNVWTLTSPGEADHQFTVTPDGGARQDSSIVWVQSAEWEDLRVPFFFRFGIDLDPGTYKIGWRIVLLSGTFESGSSAPAQSVMSVHTAPPGSDLALGF